MDELNKFSKRFKRYADLGTSAGSLALNYLGSKILNSKNGKNAEDLSRILGNLKEDCAVIINSSGSPSRRIYQGTYKTSV